MSTTPILLWFRRDFRLSDHPALAAATARGGPVVPVFITDDLVHDLGAAPKWRLSLALSQFADALEAQGSRMILRRGVALDVIRGLIQETGARGVYWSRAYDPASQLRDSKIKSALKGDGIEAKSFPGHLLFEPWTVETKTGGFYRVYTPFWNAVKNRDVPAPLSTSCALAAPDILPQSDDLEKCQLGRAMNRGAAVVRPFVRLGEVAARDRLNHFLAHGIADYASNRDLPYVDGTSCLSENLSLGEISPRQCWHAALAALHEGKQGAETFLKELVWREFAYHLLHHTPHIIERNWKTDWDAFPWNEDAQATKVLRWQQGRTGIPFVDAAMREMYVTGRMHNRGRMIVASYLCKHLMSHWKIGMDWFEQCLIDWDPASNAMGWQWSAGSGPDATPYFRVFNPVTQLDKFDKNRAYVSRFLAEGHRNPHADALAYFKAVPRSWQLDPGAPYPAPVVGAEDGRKAALAAYENRAF
ncbi:MAG: deoxyribodipyrimidine photo-lyase [Pseudomonadota bacterium]